MLKTWKSDHCRYLAIGPVRHHHRLTLMFINRWHDGQLGLGLGLWSGRNRYVFWSRSHALQLRFFGW